MTTALQVFAGFKVSAGISGWQGDDDDDNDEGGTAMRLQTQTV